MTGGGAGGGDAFTDFTTGRAGHHATPRPGDPSPVRISEVGGVGGYTAAVALGVLLLAAIGVVVLLLA